MISSMSARDYSTVLETTRKLAERVATQAEPSPGPPLRPFSTATSLTAAFRASDDVGLKGEHSPGRHGAGILGAGEPATCQLVSSGTAGVEGSSRGGRGAGGLAFGSRGGVLYRELHWVDEQSGGRTGRASGRRDSCSRSVAVRLLHHPDDGLRYPRTPGAKSRSHGVPRLRCGITCGTRPDADPRNPLFASTCGRKVTDRQGIRTRNTETRDFLS